MSDSPVYEGLIGLENGAFSEDQRASGPPRVRSAKAAADGCSCSGRAAAIAVMFILAICAAVVSGWSYHRLGSAGRNPVTGGCAFANFVLDSGAMPSCVGWPPRREPPCSLSSPAAAFLPSPMYNNAMGPWKAVNESSSGPSGGGEVGGTADGCGIQLIKEATHLTIGKSGLYQVSAQVTFTGQQGGAGRAELVWRVNNADWIAQAKAGAATGPTHAYLSAVRRLEAGQRVSLHLSQPYTTVGMAPGMTNILLTML